MYVVEGGIYYVCYKFHVEVERFGTYCIRSNFNKCQIIIAGQCQLECVKINSLGVRKIIGSLELVV